MPGTPRLKTLDLEQLAQEHLTQILLEPTTLEPTTLEPTTLEPTPLGLRHVPQLTAVWSGKLEAHGQQSTSPEYMIVVISTSLSI